MAYPIPANKVLQTLTVVLKHEPTLVKVLKSCTARIELDSDQGWHSNDTTTYYQMLIEVPPEMFADIRDLIEEMEKTIQEHLKLVSKSTPNHWIAGASLVLGMVQEGSPVPADPDAVKRIWKAGMFRLFISHRSEEKDAATKIKDGLATYGVSGFVAHEDTHPTEEWEVEILNGLRSMQALCVLITPKLHESTWCNQEIGFALGIGVPIIPICVDGNLPQGFIAKVQGIHTSSRHLGFMTDPIMEALNNNVRTIPLMRECLIEALVHSPDFGATSVLYKRIAALPDLTKEETERMKAAFDNDQVATYGASEKIKALIQQQHPRWGKTKPPPSDDDIPF